MLRRPPPLSQSAPTLTPRPPTSHRYTGTVTEPVFEAQPGMRCGGGDLGNRRGGGGTLDASGCTIGRRRVARVRGYPSHRRQGRLIGDPRRGGAGARASSGCCGRRDGAPLKLWCPPE